MLSPAQETGKELIPILLTHGQIWRRWNKALVSPLANDVTGHCCFLGRITQQTFWIITIQDLFHRIQGHGKRPADRFCSDLVKSFSFWV
jgi:hypothetical protein